MKKNITYFLLLLSILFSNKSYSQWAIGGSTGIMSGTNNLIIGSELVSTSPYIIYKDVYGKRKSVSHSVSLQVGYVFNNLHLFGGYNVGTNDVNPAFFQVNGGWRLLLGESDFAVMPYTGLAYRIRNLEQRDYGMTGTAGIQIQKWIYREYLPSHFVFLQSEYSYRHLSVSIGVKYLLKKQ